MDFYEKVRRVCLEIPSGKAATYGQIALLCGKPKNSRQVGYALRTGKAGEEIPAHRVVNASGILSGAHAFATPDLQKRMLEAEGVQVCRTQKGWQVDLKKYGWKHTAEDAERFYYMFGRRKKSEQRSYDRERKEPVVRSSICTGEKVAGFKDKETGKFEDILLVRTEADLEQFCEMYGVEKSVIKTIY